MIVTRHLDEALEAARSSRGGEVTPLPQSSYGRDENALAAAFVDADGSVTLAGDHEDRFAIQSMSKAFVYAMALQECGLEAVGEVVDVEPSGESYDKISLESGTHRPDNPMINAGALVVHALLGGRSATSSQREEKILDVFSRLAGRRLGIDAGVFDAEFVTAHRNFAIAHMLASFDAMPDDPIDVVRGYLRQCAISVTVEDLATMAATLATGGVQPRTGERIFDEPVTRQVLSVMMTCGMYESAGDWVSEVGIPAKSGISGGILGAAPGRGGVAVYSPRLDPEGNSVRGQRLFQNISDSLGLHFVDSLWRVGRPAGGEAHH